MKIAAALAVALAAMCFASHALAARVRFLSDAGETFDRRVTAELESVGFEVERPVSRETPLSPDTVAIVSVGARPAAVEVWLVSEEGHATLSTTIERDPAAGEDTDSTRVAERLRALLQPLVERPEREPETQPLPPPPAPIVAPAAAPAPTTAPPPRDRAPEPRTARTPLGFDLAGAAVSQPGGVATSVLLRARYDFALPFGAGLLVAVPLTKTTVREGDASAELDARLAGAAAHVHVLRDEPEWQLRLGAGCGVAWLTALGDARAPLQGRRKSAVTALPFIALDGARRLSGDVSVALGVLAGVTLPKADVELAGEPVSAWGRPLVLAHLGFGYDP